MHQISYAKLQINVVVLCTGNFLELGLFCTQEPHCISDVIVIECFPIVFGVIQLIASHFQKVLYSAFIPSSQIGRHVGLILLVQRFKRVAQLMPTWPFIAAAICIHNHLSKFIWQL